MMFTGTSHTWDPTTTASLVECHIMRTSTAFSLFVATCNAGVEPLVDACGLRKMSTVESSERQRDNDKVESNQCQYNKVEVKSDECQRNDYVVGWTRERQSKVASLAAVGARWNILGRCEPSQVVVSRHKSL